MVQYTTQMPMASSPLVCLDGVNTRLYRPADWQSLMIGFMGYERPGQLKWLTASGIFCVCLVGARGIVSWAAASFLYGWLKAPSVRRMRRLHLLKLKWSTQILLVNVRWMGIQWYKRHLSPLYFWFMRRTFPRSNNNIHNTADESYWFEGR